MSNQKIKIDVDLNVNKFVHTPFGLYLKRIDMYFVKKLPDNCIVTEKDNIAEIIMDLNYFRKNNIKRFLYDATYYTEENKGQRLQTRLENLFKPNLVDSIRLPNS